MKQAGLYFSAFLLFVLHTSYRTPDRENVNLIDIKPLTEHVLLHVSYLETKEWGNVPCNGLVFIRNGEALILDAPTVNEASERLIEYIESKYDAQIKGVVVNHFHDDCLGGLRAFHEHGIPSYASERTIALARMDTLYHPEIPQHGFRKALTLEIGGETVINRYFGKAHTSDNIVSYIPSEKVLFGGCMIKSDGSGKGNLADADVKAWPKTVRKVSRAFARAEYVVPGHGAVGDTHLLNYTIALFSAQ